MKRIWPVLGVALFLVVVGLLVYVWRVGLPPRSGVELVVRTDRVAVFMDDEQALVDWFATHGWWETGVRTIDAVAGGTAEQVTPTLIVIEVTDEVQPFRDLYQEEVFGSYAVLREDGRVVLKVQVATDPADAEGYERTLDVELTKAAIMEAEGYAEEQKGELYNQYLSQYQTSGWPGFLRVEPR